MSTVAPTQPTVMQADSAWVPSSLYRLTLEGSGRNTGSLTSFHRAAPRVAR